ncbi:MAG TPA: hypothetical protein VIC34_03685 [Croceibacterium sp.]|jgi:hypothetical protein
MRVAPDIAALRKDRAPQLQAQAAMFAAREAWQFEAGVAQVLADLEEFGRGAPLSSCLALAELFATGEAAGQFADRFSSAFAGVLAREPLGQLPFRHGYDGVLSTLLLARSGPARLTLVAHEPGKYEASSVLFSDGARHDAVIAGEATARLTTRLVDGSFEHDRLNLAAQARLALDLSRKALFVERVERRLVALRLQRDAPMAGPVREFSLADGRLLQQSAGEPRHSRHEMMVALLGRMKRREAAPLIAEIAGEAWPDTLRWQALREALALDTAIGFAALGRIARSSLDPLAVPAGALRAQLIEAHPELRQFEEAQCRE